MTEQEPQLKKKMAEIIDIDKKVRNNRQEISKKLKSGKYINPIRKQKMLNRAKHCMTIMAYNASFDSNTVTIKIN